MNKRSSFYPNGEFIPYQMPQDFRLSQGRGSCGNCGLYSNKHGFSVCLNSPSPMKYTSRYFANLINKPINHSNAQCHKIMDIITYPLLPFLNQ